MKKMKIRLAETEIKNLRTYAGRHRLSENDIDDWEPTVDEVSYYDTLADEANKHPEEWISAEDLAKELGIYDEVYSGI